MHLTKACVTCGTEKPISRFSEYNNGYGVRTRNTCKDCKNLRSRGTRFEQSKRYYNKNFDILSAKKKQYYRANQDRLQKYSRDHYKANQDVESIKRRARAYGITEEKVTDILSRGCEVCGSDGSDTKKGLHIDHCHTTNKVRGCLCHFCNTALGNLRDDKNLILKLGEYLDKHQ